MVNNMYNEIKSYTGSAIKFKLLSKNEECVWM